MSLSQQQTTTTTTTSLQDDCLSARRVAVEAVHIARATNQQVQQQQEQLEAAERHAHETEFILQKANRKLKGMTTWSGWLVNQLTREPVYVVERDGGGNHNNSTSNTVPLTYNTHDYPTTCHEALQAIQNYHANLNVYCMAHQERETLAVICNAMYSTAVEKVSVLEEDSPYKTELQHHLQMLRERQQQNTASIVSSSTAEADNNNNTKERRELFGATTTDTTTPPNQDSSSDDLDSHLSFCSTQLSELHSLAHSLSDATRHQNALMTSLQDTTANITDQTRRVSRRTEAMTSKKSWNKQKKQALGMTVSIQHVKTGYYLAIDASGGVVLSESANSQYRKHHPALFSVHAAVVNDSDKKNTTNHLPTTIALCNQNNGCFLEQSWLSGRIVCSSTTISGVRCDWELDEPIHQNQAIVTRLLCVGAGWSGGGGHVVVSNNKALSIGSVQTHADRFRIKVVDGL